MFETPPQHKVIITEARYSRVLLRESKKRARAHDHNGIG